MQSLNEELQSSNEELQSSNEELETTNEELQSTNEELQTAYTELKALYDDKEKRTTQLEELSNKLKDQTSDYRKQKEITEGILDTAPVAIIMTDDIGNIIFANAVAERLFVLSKKQLLTRTYDSSAWNIKDFDGNPIPNEHLPFSVIKKTYEPLLGAKQTVEIGGNTTYLSINGAPLFDVEGRFYGAVFSLVDITEIHHLRSNVREYERTSQEHQKMLDEKLSQSLGELKSKGYYELFAIKFDLMHYAMLDLGTSMRNNLSNVMLLLKSLPVECSTCKKLDETTKGLGDIANNLNKELDTLISYYNIGLHHREQSVYDMLKQTFEILEFTLAENDITVDFDLDESLKCPKNTKNTKILFLALCELFIFAKVRTTTSSASTLHVKSELLGDNTPRLTFVLDALDLKGFDMEKTNNVDLLKIHFNEAFGGLFAIKSEGTTLEVSLDFT